MAVGQPHQHPLVEVLRSCQREGASTRLNRGIFTILTEDVIIQTIAVQDTESGIKIAYRKKGASPHAVRSSYSTLVVRPRSGGRRAAGVTAQLAKRGYRPDLRAVSVPSLNNIYVYSFLATRRLAPLQAVFGRSPFASFFGIAPPRARWTAARHYESWVWTCCAKSRGSSGDRSNLPRARAMSLSGPVRCSTRFARLFGAHILRI